MGSGSGWAWGGVKVLWNVQDKIFFWHVNGEVRTGRMGVRDGVLEQAWHLRLASMMRSLAHYWYETARLPA